MGQKFVVRREDIEQTGWENPPSEDITDGAVRLRIDAFALTSNNITYAALGDAMNYWSFFPTTDDDTGCIPVWGFASVTESRCAGVDVGERFYGYWPMADEAVLQPVRVDAVGFIDGAEHRRALPAFYNHYLRCSADPLYKAEHEAQLALLRPLFGTAFLLDDFFADNEFFGADAVVLSSASSKTAYGTAFCLGQRRGTANARTVVGITSPANVEFARSLGCYDQVLRYDEVPSKLIGEPAIYIDFSGSAPVRHSVHHRLADTLTYSCSVGATHWDSPLGGGELPGPAPVFFFAPAYGQKRAAEWGAAGLQERIATAWALFMEPVTDPANPWLQVVRAHGPAAVGSSYAALLHGRIPPAEGHLLSV